MNHASLSKLFKQLFSLPTTSTSDTIQSQLIHSVYQRIILKHKPSLEDYSLLLKYYADSQDTESIYELFTEMKQKEFIPTFAMTSMYFQHTSIDTLYQSATNLINLYHPSIISSACYSRTIIRLLSHNYNDALTLFTIFRKAYTFIQSLTWNHILYHAQKHSQLEKVFREYIEYLEHSFHIDSTSLLPIAAGIHTTSDVLFCTRVYDLLRKRIDIKHKSSINWLTLVNVYGRKLAKIGDYKRVFFVLDQEGDNSEKSVESRLLSLNVYIKQHSLVITSSLVDKGWKSYKDSKKSTNGVSQMLELLLHSKSEANCVRLLKVINAHITFEDKILHFFTLHSKYLISGIKMCLGFSEQRQHILRILISNQVHLPQNFLNDAIIGAFEEDLEFAKCLLDGLPIGVRIKLVTEMIQMTEKLNIAKSVVEECIGDDMLGFVNFSVVDKRIRMLGG